MKLKNLANFIKNEYDQRKTIHTVFNSRESRFEEKLLTEREFQALLSFCIPPSLASAQWCLQRLSQESSPYSPTNYQPTSDPVSANMGANTQSGEV